MIFKQFDSYPKLGALLMNIFPIYEFLQPKTYKLFVKYCKSEKLARQALTINLLLIVKIENIILNGVWNRTIGGIYRGTYGGELHTVYMNTQWADAYEKEQNSGNAKIAEITILHEMIHWARHIGGNPEVPGEEAGVDFANEVWGVSSSRGGIWWK